MVDQPTIPVHPVQANRGEKYKQAYVPQVVTMKAYEVYCHVYGRQEALVTGGCRGGFSVGELIAFLYASSFPKDQWSARVDEAFRGATNL
jgi:hypothetical protein